MVKRTLCFSNPAYLSVRNGQLTIRLGKDSEQGTTSVPIEDIGVLLLDHQQITITHGALTELVGNNAVVITCNAKHMPAGYLLPLEGNTVQCERFNHQIEASLPLKKQLWQQTVVQKIRNQASVLHNETGETVNNMIIWSNQVKSGDSDNLEGRAAAYYWPRMFPEFDGFVREQEGDYPNNLLNYGYAILRAVIARALVSSGLLPTLGIHHHNRYNAYCLADDIMEPYRPYVDCLVKKCMLKYPEQKEITTDLKRELLSIPVLDVVVNGKRSPLMVAASMTTASLYKCYSGEIRKLVYPEISNANEPVQ